MSIRLSSAPHIRTSASTQSLMLNVVIAMMPCAIAGIYLYEISALTVLLVSTATAVVCEYLWQRLMKIPVRVGDCSALVTGIVLGLTLPPTLPWWAAMVGSAFAIIVVKQLFGGIGDNFLNPALTARAVLLASWPARMTTYVDITRKGIADAATMATPLSGAPVEITLKELWMGTVPGAIGETCKYAIVIGLAYMLITKTISWRIPVITILSAFVSAFVLGMDPVVSILAGGILFGAVFMATDYTTSPMSASAQYAYAAGIGVLTMIIRKFGAYPEGVTYAILIMNILTPLLDKYMPNRIYGHGKKKEAKKAGWKRERADQA